MYNIIFLLAMYTFSGDCETDIYIEMFPIGATKRLNLPRVAVTPSAIPPSDPMGKINNSTDPFDCLCEPPCFALSSLLCPLSKIAEIGNFL